MATVPTSATHVRLLKGIPFQSDYKNTRWFDSQASQASYFTNKIPVYDESDVNFQTIEGRHFFRVNMNIEDLWNVNYMMFQNSSYTTKWFYGFVTKLEWQSKHATNVYFEIDVFQTWWFDVNFKPSFVVREHQDLWNADGTPVINTQDEGLYYGSEYQTVYAEKYLPYPDIYFLVIVSKSTLHGTSPNVIQPSPNGLPVQPLCYYVHPFYLDNGYGTPSVVVGGTSYLLTDLGTLLKDVYSVTNAQKDVVSLYITNFFGDDLNYSDTAPNLTFFTGSYEQATIGSSNTIYVNSLPNYHSNVKHDFGNKYDNFNPVDESKLLMYPYAFTQLVDLRGNQVTFKNEYINGTNIVINILGSLGTSNKVSYSIQDYNLSENPPIPLTEQLQKQVALENGLIDNNANDIAILSDYLSAFIQGNRNQLDNQTNHLAFQAIMDGVSGVAQGAAGMVSANPMGMASGLIGTARGMGNDIFAIRNIEAKIKDLSHVPPSMVKMGSNTEFDFGNGLNGVFLIQKQITPEYQKKLSDFFNMFGYKQNEVKVPNFHTRQNWNFVQTKSCVITGDLNNEDLNELKSVFDNGITLWHTDDIGNYSLANGVI